MTTLVLTATCWSCGRAPKEERSAAVERAAAAAAPASRPESRPLIAAFGDSLTAGVVEHPYPEYLQAMLDKAHLRYRVENAGVSGDTTSDGLARIDSVISLKPSLLILEFGGNDGLRGIPIEETLKNLDQMLARLRAERLRTVLIGITLPPNYGPDYVKPFNAMYPKLARKYRVPLLPFLLLHVYQHPDMMQPDGIHPSNAGNRIVAADVYAFIRPLLK